jgi:hypothetical protein
MTALRNTASSTWIDRKDGSDLVSRLGDAARLVVNAMNAGLDAEHEYNKLTRHGVTPQHASAVVLKKLAR